MELIGKVPKQLVDAAKLANKAHPGAVESLEAMVDDRGEFEGFQIGLKGYTVDNDGQHGWSGETLEQAIKDLESIRPCECESCTSKSKGNKVMGEDLQKSGILYFDLHFEDYNLEDDLGNIGEITDEDHLAELASYKNDKNGLFALSQEDKALEHLEKLFGRKIGNEGHGSYGDLVCKIPVSSHEEVEKLNEIVERNTIGGDDEIDAGERYHVARGFTLFPEGVNGPRYSHESSSEGTIADWLEVNKPSKGGKAAEVSESVKDSRALIESIERKLSSLEGKRR